MLNFYKEGILKNIIPLLLCISIVTSCMYVYTPGMLPFFIIITFFIQASVFSFYTFLSQKSMLLKFVSVLGSFAAICGMVTIALKTGNNKSSIDYFIWFLSPQALVEFSLPYIVATFIVINFFIASTVYYFSAVRYRISMTFLITLIPFAFYRKEGEPVPVFFALLLLVMYIALMIHCRQLNTKPNQKLIIDSGYKKSMFGFLFIATFLAFAIPKPDIKFNNSWVDSVFESQKLTDYMLSRLGLVSDTATSSVTYIQTSNIKLYEFMADEYPINLKSQTYSKYSYAENMWRTGKNELEGSAENMNKAELLNPAEFYNAVMKAAEYDKEYSEKYKLGDFKSELVTDYKSTVSLLSTRILTKYYYTPVNAYKITIPFSRDIYRSENGMLFTDTNTGTYYTVNYYSDSSSEAPDFKKLIKKFDMNNFGEFIDETAEIINKADAGKYADVLNAYSEEYKRSLEYLEEFGTSGVPESLQNLADSITEKCNSDYEKAYAIQDYFKLNDYIYDLTYVKPDDYNMEYFLMTGKTGICSDYATAMVLLSRLSGIPARYAEGIHLHDPDENGIITVRDSDLHAFPELYISGYGWMSFEPTQLNAAEEKSGFDYKLSVIMISAALLLIILAVLWEKIFRYRFSEYIFSIKLKRSSDEKAVILIVNRIRKILGISRSTTSGETASYINEILGMDFSETAEKYDSILYGGCKSDPETREKIYKLYTDIKEILKKSPEFSGKKINASEKNI